jgi:hypothetical protein
VIYRLPNLAFDCNLCRFTKALKALADFLLNQSKAFGKEGRREAIELYERSSDIMVMEYGWAHPATVAAHTALEVAPGRQCSPRHRMLIYSIIGPSECAG